MSKPHQDELPLESVRPHAIWPGRKSIYVFEVARALEMSENQVIDLIESGQLVAINIASGVRSDANPKGSKTPRNYWRIPVSEYDRFLDRRKSA